MIARALGALLVCTLLLTTGARSKPASIVDRKLMAVEVANYIQQHGTFKGAKQVMIGRAIVEGMWALADWKAAKGSQSGQVGFYFACDHWNVGVVSVGTNLTARTLAGMWSFEPLTAAAKTARAQKLIAQMQQARRANVAYLPPAKATGGC